MERYLEVAAITILSKHGYTPVIQVRHGLRTEWKTFPGLIGASYEEILDWVCETVRKAPYPYEFWMTNKGVVDDCGLVRWMKAQMKSAASVEEILRANGTRNIFCSYAGKDGSFGNNVYCNTTEEFDKWIEQSRNYPEGSTVKINIPYSGNRFRVPERKKPEGPFIISAGKDGWVKSLKLDGEELGICYCGCPKDALRVEKWDDVDLVKLNQTFYGKEYFQKGRNVLKFESAAIQNEPFDTIIKLSHSAVHYLQTTPCSNKISITSTARYATRFANKQEAERVIQKLTAQKRFTSCWTPEAVSLVEESQK